MKTSFGHFEFTQSSIGLDWTLGVTWMKFSYLQMFTTATCNVCSNFFTGYFSNPENTCRPLSILRNAQLSSPLYSKGRRRINPFEWNARECVCQEEENSIILKASSRKGVEKKPNCVVRCYYNSVVEAESRTSLWARILPWYLAPTKIVYKKKLLPVFVVIGGF